MKGGVNIFDVLNFVLSSPQTTILVIIGTQLFQSVERNSLLCVWRGGGGDFFTTIKSIAMSPKAEV